ncbi:MAG: hypothetical protein JNM64_07875, partial [Chloroflexia bacterium]|nr:hypothetical protein [Chloroflexia bacterium]
MKPRPGFLIAAGSHRFTRFTAWARPLRCGVMLALLLPMLRLALGAEALAAEPTPGFEDHPVATLYGEPTDLAWLGDDLL